MLKPNIISVLKSSGIFQRPERFQVSGNGMIFMSDLKNEPKNGFSSGGSSFSEDLRDGPRPSSHPVSWIRGAGNSSLAGKRIVLGVTGSIAAVRTVELARELARCGAVVHAVMTEAATHILHPDALVYATGNPVITELTGNVEHVSFFGHEGCADLLLIAPATANTIAKIASGIDDTPVTTFATTAIGEGKKVMIVPAMHGSMYDHPQVRTHIRTLGSWGISVIGPEISEGVAKIASNDRIVNAVRRELSEKTLEGRRVLVTSGPTAEKVDPIRILTNRSSGKTGEALALEAWRRGADVYLFRSNDRILPIPEDSCFHDIRTESAADMTQAVLQRIYESPSPRLNPDILISAAAIADYTAVPEKSKIRSGGVLILDLAPTAKLIKEVRKADSDLLIVAFKAETEPDENKLIDAAIRKMNESDADMIIANDVSEKGMGTDDNLIFLISGRYALPGKSGKSRSGRSGVTCVSGPKGKLASLILDRVEKLPARTGNENVPSSGSRKNRHDDGPEYDSLPGDGTDASGDFAPKYYEMGGGGIAIFSRKRRKPAKMQGRTFLPGSKQQNVPDQSENASGNAGSGKGPGNRKKS